MRRLLIFLKYPTPGQVKTRLATEIGAEAAAAIARACTELTLERIEPLRRETVLCVDPPEALARTRKWLDAKWSLQPQRGETLGERLAQATQHAFTEGATQVVVIGTDSPWIAREDIDVAFDALRSHDVVIGPTEDGGYYLIGLSKLTPTLFEGIGWSSSSVFEESMSRVRTLGLRTQQLLLGYDLDYPDDVQRFVAEEATRGQVSSRVDTIATLMNHRRQPCPS